METFKAQKRFYNNSNKRLNIATGSVRSGKTYIEILRWIKFIGEAPPGDLIMSGKTDGSLYRNVIRPMQSFLGSDMKFTSSKAPGNPNIKLWGRDIFTFGANDERAEGKIRGMTVAGGLGDEMTLWPQSYFEQHLNRMSVKGAKFFGATNTDSPNHWLKKNYIDRADELDLYHQSFIIDDNTFLPLEYIKSLKLEKTGLWYKRDILGLWVLAQGAIYDFFTNREPYSLYRRDLPTAAFKVASCDYGTSNPCTFGVYGVNMYSFPKIWLEREYVWDSKEKGKQKTDSEYSEDMADFIGNDNLRSIIVDPSATSFKAELRKNPNIKAIIIDADNSVLEGIKLVSKMWKAGEYAINRNCKYTIAEAEGYVWDSNAQKRGEDKPLKLNDHCMDRDRYAVNTVFGKTKQVNWSIINNNLNIR